MTEVTSYTELIAGIRTQVEAMGVRQLDFDNLAGFTPGLSGKVFGLLQVRQLRLEYMFAALRAAGLRMRLEVDPEQQAKMIQRIATNYNPKQANQARNGHSASPAGPAVMSRIFKPLAKMGGKARMAKMTKEELTQHQRMAAMAGVRKRRKETQRRARQRKRAHAARKQANAQTT